MAKVEDGKGLSKVPETPEAQRRKRKEVQARRRHSRGQQPPRSSNFSFEEWNNERREQERAATRRTHRQALSAQATKARECDRFTGLEAGSLAHQVAEAILELFPDIPSQPQRSRTQVAEEKVISLLSEQDRCRDRAIRLGCAVARDALRWAYEQLRTEQAAA